MYEYVCEYVQVLRLSGVKRNLNISIAPHLLSLLIGSLLEDNNNAKQEPIVLYN